MDDTLIRPWNKIKIDECSEPLSSIPTDLYRLEPHPYLALGAPYGERISPWFLRNGVIRRLILAQEYLQLEDSDLILAIFDAWRPIAVQAFMVDHEINQQCKLRGINRYAPNDQIRLQHAIADVETFWANPTNNPKCPPPHSTGGAVDLTLADRFGNPLDMGGEIDEIGPVSKPEYYFECPSNDDPLFSEILNSRRMLLAKVMKLAGFVQHPLEWWHFSFGDQLWAWKTTSLVAIYGTWFDDRIS